MSRFCVRKGKASAGVSSGAFPAAIRALCRVLPRGSRSRFCVSPRNPSPNPGWRERLRGVDRGRRHDQRARDGRPAGEPGRAGEGADRHHRLRRDHQRWPAPGAADPGDRRGRLRQDPVRHRVPRARCPRLRRARRAAGVRGGPERPRHQRRVARLRPRTSSRRTACSRSTPSGWTRPRSSRPAPSTSRGCSSGSPMAVESVGRQAGLPRHHRAAVQRPAQRGDHPRRARPAVPVAQGTRPDGRDQRRARQASAT